jgi:hypothetical protein
MTSSSHISLAVHDDADLKDLQRLGSLVQKHSIAAFRLSQSEEVVS